MSRNPFFPALPDIIAVKEDCLAQAVRKGPGRRSPCDVLSLYYRGGPRYRIDRRTYAVTPPYALLVPRGTLDCDLQTGGIAGIFVMFHGHGLVRKAPDRPQHALISLGAQRSIVPFTIPLRRVESDRLLSLLHEIPSARAAGFTGPLRSVALLFHALAQYCAAATPRARTDGHREAWRLRDMLDARPYANTQLAALYELLDLSAAHAEKLFRAAFHITPVAYRLQLRLSKARELLVSSTMNVGQAARTVGFTDPLYFSRLFRRVFGLAPSDLIRDFGGRRRHG